MIVVDFQATVCWAYFVHTPAAVTEFHMSGERNDLSKSEVKSLSRV